MKTEIDQAPAEVHTSGKRETEQLNVKINAALYGQFRRACGVRGESMRDVIESLCNAYTLHEEMKGQFHLDGTKCPFSVLIDAIAESVRANVEGRSAEEFRLMKETSRALVSEFDKGKKLDKSRIAQ